MPQAPAIGLISMWNVVFGRGRVHGGRTAARPKTVLQAQTPCRRRRPIPRPIGPISTHAFADPLDLGDRRAHALDLLPTPWNRSRHQPDRGFVRERQPSQARPCPRLGPLDQTGAGRVALDVPRDRQQMLILLGWKRLEASLLLMAAGVIMARGAPDMGRH